MRTGDFPDYGYPCGMVAGLAFSVLSGRRRSFRADAIRATGRLEPPLRVIGQEHIPQNGPCVLTPNHYHRAGFGAAWLALGVSALVPREVHWIMTAEWTAPGKWYELFKGWYSRLLLQSLSRAYGFTSMPPMPPRPKDVEARAKSVRAVLEVARRQPDFMIGLAPEGADQAGGALSMPAPGVGRFALLLGGLGAAFAPVGAYEEDGRFCLHFGPPYRLEVPAGLPPGEKDCLAADILMKKIAVLLPARLRGAFAPTTGATTAFTEVTAIHGSGCSHEKA